MACRFFTADFHLHMPQILQFEKRPYKDINEHDNAIIKMCKDLTTYGDIIVHLGDLYSFGTDRGEICGKELPIAALREIPATFINVRGNHDIMNKVKSTCDSMQLQLGRRYPNVICGHYPSYNEHAKNYIRKGWILLCGHVHSSWQHCLDLTNQILNINVGLDANNYRILSEDKLIKLIDKTLSIPLEQMHKIKIIDGKVQDV